MLLQVGQRERNWRKEEKERLLQIGGERGDLLRLMIRHRTQWEVL